VVTIGAITDEYIERKGLDTFARTSRLLPEIRFVLIGAHASNRAVERLRQIGGANLSMVGYLKEDEVEAYLRPNAVYAQLSLHEAFGCAVAESMQRMCTPVVTRLGALPEVVGDCGYYVNPKDPAAAAKAIQRAFAEPLGSRARDRIDTTFPLGAREQKLWRAVSATLSHGRSS
jgi:glycosyltransferase involved in cell wall biosynthesis